MLKTNFLTHFPANKKSFFVHSTTPNAPYVHPRLDSILELWWILRMDTMLKYSSALDIYLGLFHGGMLYILRSEERRFVEFFVC